MNTSNGYEEAYYQPKEIRMYFWSCSNEKCSWCSDAQVNANDLDTVDECPECKCVTITLDSDFFEE